LRSRARARDIRAHCVKVLRFGASLALVLGLWGCSEAPVAEPDVWTPPAAGFVEVWRDEFDGPAGSAADETKWNVEVNELGYNDELNYNTPARTNSFVDGSGHLVLRALKEHYVASEGAAPSSQPYTSARLNTQGKLEQTYGRFEARIQLPSGGRGVWPAFWMLGADLEQVGWPDCGEVDILEWRGSQPSTIVSSLHGPNYSGGSSYHGSYELPGGSQGEFHTYSFEWTQDSVRWLVDGNELFTKSAEAMGERGHRWVYDHPFFLVINLAIGGIFDGDPDDATVFPQQMLVDYVSVSRLERP
jgi:beta-glucanase (GH16 family)